MNAPAKKIALVVGAALLALSGATAHAQQTLKQVVEQTIQTSPDLLIDVAKRKAAIEGVDVAWGNYLPKVDLLLGGGRAKTDLPGSNNAGWLNRRETQITLSQMLFDGFATSSEVDRRRAIAESAGYRVAGSSDQIGLQVVEAYLEVLRLQEVLAVSRESLAAHERVYEQIKLRAGGGLSKKSDQDQVEARLALAKANVAASEGNLREAEYNFQRLTGTKPTSLVKPQPVDAALLPKSIDEGVKTALENHPILRSAEVDIRQAEAQHEAAKSRMYPRLDVELGHSRDKGLDAVDETTKNTYAMLRLRYNLFNGLSDRAQSRQTKEQVFEAQEVMHRTRRQVEQSLLLSWNAYEAAQSRLPSLRQHADFSNLTREAYGKQFALGQRTLLDVLDGENEYFTASTNYINAQYVEQFARYRILADVGALLDALGVPHREEALLVKAEAKNQAAQPAKTEQ